jgi:hypothetical protein
MPACSSRPSFPTVAIASSCESSGMRQHRLGLLPVMILVVAMSSAFSAVHAQGSWSTAQVSVAHSNGAAASVRNVALFAGGTNGSALFWCKVNGFVVVVVLGHLVSSACERLCVALLIPLRPLAVSCALMQVAFPTAL